MSRILQILIALLMGLHLVQAQELPKNVKILQNDFIAPGVYYLKLKNSESYSDNVNINILKRYTANGYIIKINKGISKRALRRGDIYQIGDDWKLSPGLAEKKPEKEVYLTIQSTDGKAFREGSEYELVHAAGDFFVIKASPEEFEALIADPLVSHIGRYHSPKQEAPVNFYDLSVNKINLAHHNFPDLRGEGLKVSIKEEFFDTTDIDLRGRFEVLGLESSDLNQHATLIATLISGGGNSGSRSLGVAPGAVISSSSFLNTFPAAVNYYSGNEIYVENHSYGGAIATEYGNEAAAFDELVYKLPQLVHVFSSGNSGQDTPDAGPYNGVEGYANLTGNYKTAKNVLTIGAVDKKGMVISRSSKGPTSDGRVKPELVAFALAGTSDAAALVSGSTLLLQDQFLKKEGRYPTVATVKAVLVAGAEDVGPENVDYSTGFGNLDIHTSLQIIEAGNYITGSLEAGRTRDFTITVPEGTAELKVALSWVDPPANPGDEVVLRNNLDLEVEDPEGKAWLPWVLDAGTDLESLEKLAVRAEDSLNPLELVSVQNPLPGEYILKIQGDELQVEQEFSLAYDTTAKDHFAWSFPTSTDAVMQDQEEYVRWESGLEGQGQLEFRYQGEEWQILSPSVELSSENYKWVVPAQSGMAQLRLTTDTGTYESELFAISPEIFPQVLYNCETEMALTWPKISGATGYLVQQLGERYMEDLQRVEDTLVRIPKNMLQSEFVSVTPLFAELKGKQGLAVNYTRQGVQCYFRNFYAFLNDQPTVNATLNLSTSSGVRKVQFLKDTGGNQHLLKEFDISGQDTALSYEDIAVLDGTSRYYALIFLQDGTKIRTNEVEIYLPAHNTFKIYPNPIPAGELLTIVSRGDDLVLEIFDMQGQRVSREHLVSYTDKIEMTMSVPGVYIVRALRNGKLVGVGKLLVK